MTSDDMSRKPRFEPAQEEKQKLPDDLSGASRGGVSDAPPQRLPKRRRAWTAVGIAAVLTASGLIWAVWPGSSSTSSNEASPHATPTSPLVPQGPTKVSLDPSGQVVELPVLYPTIKAAAPPGVKWEGPGANFPDGFNIGDQLSIWGVFNQSSAHALRVEVVRYSSNGKAAAVLRSDRAGCTGENKRRCAGYSPPDTDGPVQVLAGTTGRFETVRDLGDEAFSVPVTQQRFKSPSAMEQNETLYDIGGSAVECRFRNVLIIVSWRGADYPASAAGHNPLQGTPLPYAQSRDEAVSVVRAIISKLTQPR